MKLTGREKKFVIGGSAIGALALLLYVALVMLPSREALSSSVSSKKMVLLKQRETLSREAAYKARIGQYRQRLKQNMSRLLPGDKDSIAGAELQRVLKDLADHAGVEILRKDLQATQKLQDGLLRVSVRIETNCQPDQLVQFLAAIENYASFLTLDELQINGFRMQKKYEIRPSIIVSGYIMGPETKPGDNVASVR